MAPPEGIVLRRSERARTYRLTLRRDGTAVATIPVRGSEREAWRFVERHRDWLERARARQEKRPRAPEAWIIGASLLWRGELREIRAAGPATVCLAADVFRVSSLDGDLRPALEAHFVRRARVELPARTWEISASTGAAGAAVRRVTVRNQRSRWGSCSAGGTISLNWRLVQTPDLVRDYIIYHEIAHLAEMNHSDRFWARVEEMCPTWREAERWIKRNSSLVGL